jgi:hypothetical protein
MSLINEALKKAQRERTETTAEPPSFAADSTLSASPAPRRRPGTTGGPSPVLLGAGAALVLALLVGAGLFLFRSKSAPAVPADAGKPSATVAGSLTTVSTATPVQPKDEGRPAAEAPLTTVHTEPTPAFKITIPEAPAKAPAAVASKPAPALEPVSEPASNPTAKMIDMIEALRISGIRAAGADSKVLMNDRVFRLNDIVDRDLGVRLIGVENGALTFRDTHGAVYTRHF